MKQSVSHYVMPDEKEEATAELVHRLGLDGIENLIYGDEPSSNLFTSLTVGAHLRFWPRWMDFYLGNTKRCKNSSLMKKPLPLTMVPPTRTAGLKKYGKISARRWRKSRSTSYGMWRTVLWKKHGHGSFITLRKTFFGKRRLFTMPFPKKCLKRWKSFSKIFSGRGCAAFCLLK